MVTRWIRNVFLSLALVTTLGATEVLLAEEMSPVESLILVGDAGDTTKEYMKFVKREAEKIPASIVLFLGDNVYPAGLPNKNDPHYDKAQRSLNLQAKPFVNSNARVFFIQGNHDWDDSGPKGLDNVRNAKNYLSRILGTATVRPRAGCPGPDVVHVSKHLYVIAIDSQWFLHPYVKPTNGDGECQFSTIEQFSEELKRLVQQRPESAALVIAHHHPLASSGKHAHGTRCPGDLGCPAYQKFIETITTALKLRPALLCAAGHDHILEVRQNSVPGCLWGVISGTGSKITTVNKIDEVVFAEALPGLARLDIYANGTRKLRMVKAPTGEILFEQTLLAEGKSQE